MRWIKAIIVVLSTYTRLPMPKSKWDDDAMKLAIAFLPFAGAVVGIGIWVWQVLCRYFDISPVLFASIATILPIMITGGIHMDGYCDTSDALASWQEKERRLDILKDSHIGAFALIRSFIYMFASFGVLYELFVRGIDTGIPFLYILSRCFAAWSTMTMPNARKNGMLAAFTSDIYRREANGILILFSVLGLVGWLFFTFPYGIWGLVLCLPVALWYRNMAKKYFGGATGDTTGYFLQLIELTLLIGLLIGGIL